jgi:hypothetical protein
LAPLNHTDDARVITTGILRQNPEKVAETSSSEVSPLNRSRFHTVCLNYAHTGKARPLPAIRQRP